MQERCDEVENTRLEYNKARQKCGDAHKAAVKIHAKKDASKIEENPGVIVTEAVLTGGSPHLSVVSTYFVVVTDLLCPIIQTSAVQSVPLF